MNNTRNSLLTSVAFAALIASVGVASAQAPSPGPAVKQSAPAEKMGPALKETTGQASPEAKAPDAAKPGQKASGPKADSKQDKGARAATPAAKSTSGQAQDKDLPSKGANSETKSRGKTSSDMKADTKAKADVKIDIKSSDKSPEKAGDAKAATTGQGAAGAAASLSTEQRATIRTAVKQQNAKPMTNVNFSISLGTRVPRSVHFYRVPMELVQIYPRWRGYEYFLVGGQIIVVNPRTHEIVAVLDA
jgi:hypothetical protein